MIQRLPPWAPYAAIAFLVIFVLAGIRDITSASSKDHKPKIWNPKDKGACKVSPKFPLRIMPLGDSITFGFGSYWGNGYRLPLYDNLMASCPDRSVTFIGSQYSGTMENGETEGYPGHSIASIANETQPGLSESLAKKPNVVLLHADTNDFSFYPHDDEPNEAAPERLEWLIDYVLLKAPKTTLIVAQILHCSFELFGKGMPVFNAAIPGIVERKVFTGFKVLTVNMSHIGLEGSGDLMDDVHPADQGYEKMAKLWFAAMEVASAKEWITA